MKKAFPYLLVAVALLAPATSVLAQDSEEVQRLEIQVQRLRAEVARLNVELMELRERVKQIEKMIEDHAPMPPSEEPGVDTRPEVPERPPVRPPAFFGGSAAGTYVLDNEHMEKIVVEYAMKEVGEGLDHVSEEQRNAMLAQIKQMAKIQVGMMSLNLHLNSDGTFKADGMFGGDPLDATGTWAQDGDKVTVTTTHEDGELKDEPEVKTATYADGVLTMRPDDDVPFDIRLLKK